MMRVEQQLELIILELEMEEETSTVNHCLVIPEILENILSYLPTTDLLSARSVCKSWNNIANQLLIKTNTSSHIPNIKIQLGHSSGHDGHGGGGVKEFLATSNSPYSSQFFQQLQHFAITGNYSSFEADKGHYEAFFTKYSNHITSIEISDMCSMSIIQLLQGHELRRLGMVERLKILF